MLNIYWNILSLLIGFIIGSANWLLMFSVLKRVLCSHDAVSKGRSLFLGLGIVIKFLALIFAFYLVIVVFSFNVLYLLIGFTVSMFLIFILAKRVKQ